VAVQAVKLRSVDGNQANGMEVDQVEASTAALGIWLVLVPGRHASCSAPSIMWRGGDMVLFFANKKKRRLATWTPRPCHGDDGLFPEAGGAATTTAAAAMQKTRKRAVDGEPNVMENLDQITTNKSLFQSRQLPNWRERTEHHQARHMVSSAPLSTSGILSTPCGFADGVNGTMVPHMTMTKPTKKMSKFLLHFKRMVGGVRSKQGIFNC